MNPRYVSGGSRLLMRYPEGTFRFGNLRGNATTAGIYEFADAVASLQRVAPSEIVQVVTQQLLWGN